MYHMLEFNVSPRMIRPVPPPSRARKGPAQPGPRKRAPRAPVPDSEPGSAHLWGTQSVHRAVSILMEIASRNMRGLRAFEIAALMGLERPTTHRIVKGLLAQRMLTLDPDTKAYKLGPLVYELGLAASPHFNLRELCLPTLKRLAEKTGDSTFLVVRSGFDSVCIDRVEGSYPISARTLDIGGRRPLGVGAGSLAILITLPEDEIERVIEVNSPRFAAFGNLTPQRLRNALRQSCAAGYAINNQDVLDGVGAIGIALRPRRGAAYVAVSIAGIASRFTGARREELVQLLTKEVRTLEKRIETSGHGGAPS